MIATKSLQVEKTEEERSRTSQEGKISLKRKNPDIEQESILEEMKGIRLSEYQNMVNTYVLIIYGQGN